MAVGNAELLAVSKGTLASTVIWGIFEEVEVRRGYTKLSNHLASEVKFRVSCGCVTSGVCDWMLMPQCLGFPGSLSTGFSCPSAFFDILSVLQMWKFEIIFSVCWIAVFFYFPFGNSSSSTKNSRFRHYSSLSGTLVSWASICRSSLHHWNPQNRQLLLACHWLPLCAVLFDLVGRIRDLNKEIEYIHTIYMSCMV